jgi:type II secretory pathway predicted ATPase ExeA
VIIGVVAALDQRIGLRYTTMPPMSESENRSYLCTVLMSAPLAISTDAG